MRSGACSGKGGMFARLPIFEWLSKIAQDVLLVPTPVVILRDTSRTADATIHVLCSISRFYFT
jgi:hypothetical protein